MKRAGDRVVHQNRRGKWTREGLTENWIFTHVAFSLVSSSDQNVVVLLPTLIFGLRRSLSTVSFAFRGETVLFAESESEYAIASKRTILNKPVQAFQPRDVVPTGGITPPHDFFWMDWRSIVLDALVKYSGFCPEYLRSLCQ